MLFNSTKLDRFFKKDVLTVLQPALNGHWYIFHFVFCQHPVALTYIDTTSLFVQELK